MTRNSKPHFRALLATILIAVAGAALAQAPYPTKAIRVISPFDPGGTSDLSTRLIADIAKDMLKVPIIVENRSGGGGTVGIGQVARMPADGYTLVQFSSSPIVIRPLVADVPFDPLKDLTYIGRYMVSHSPLAVRADSPFRSLADLIKYCRENPGRLRWAAGAPQGAAHLSTLAMFRHAGVRATNVPVGGGAEAVLQLLGGQIEAASVTDFAGPLADGKIRLLAESGTVRVGTAPDVPTYKELGYPLGLSVYLGWAGPAGLPANVVSTWDETMKSVVNSQRFKDFLRAQNASPYHANSADLTRDIRQEIPALREQLQQLGMGKPAR